MAPIVESIEISRRPEDVFSYVTDAAHLTDWQESVVSVRGEGRWWWDGSRLRVTRRVGRTERAMNVELTRNPPTDWAVRRMDGPVRGLAKGMVAPIAGGESSRVTIALDFQGHGIGKLLVPLIVRRQAKAEMPRNLQKLKERLESGP